MNHPPIACLMDKITRRQAVVSIVGLGYVGLPLAVAFAQEGLRVIGVDVDPDKAQAIQAGKSYVADVPSSALATVVGQGLFSATTDYAILKDVDVVIVCVPTPLSKTRDPDMSYIIAATEQIAHYFRPGQLIVLESTTYPGTTEEILLPHLANETYQVGRDFCLAFSPERIDPGNSRFNVRNTPKVVGGMTPTCLKAAVELYGIIVQQVVPVNDPKTAEMVKLLENTFRAVNIGLINEMALMCHRLGIDVWDVIRAASTKPYGFMPFYPGPGLGGHCIPLDPFYLSWKLRTLNYNARFIELAGEINSSMPHHVVDMVVDALNARRKAVNGSRILLIGVAYKPNVADLRESPALDILKLLRDKGAVLYYNDPHIPIVDVGALHLTSSELTNPLLTAMDCVVIVTPHDGYDWANIVRQAALVVDCRNATGALGQAFEHVVRL